MSANAGSQNSSSHSLRKLAIAARVLGKELRRLKLKRVDLARADLPLGEKAYATGIAEGQAELVSKLDRVAQRLTELRQQRIQAASTLGEKAKVLASRIGKAIQIGALKLRRRRILRQLGAKLRQSGTKSSLAEEAQAAQGVADRLSSIETEIRQLRPQTYRWASQPLLITCLLLLLAAVGAFALRHKPTPVLAQQRGAAGRSSLSDEQMNKVVAQQQSFQQQMQQMVAEATRRETEERQARIAAAARTYQEQADRQRAAQEKLAAERAAADRVREAQEAKRAAERQKAAEEKQKEEMRITAAKEQQEAMEREKAARAEAERQQAERDRIAAETKSQQEERARTEREQAEREAQERQRLAEEKNKQVAEAEKKKQAATNTPQPPPSWAVDKPSGNTAGLAGMLAGLVALEAKNATAQPGGSPQEPQNSRTTQTPVDKKLREAAEKFTVGRYAEAFKLYEEAISIEPDNPKGYLARGWAFFSTSQKDAALKDFDEALKRNPKEAEGYFRRGVVHASGSEHEKAIADFTKAIECRPEYAEAYYERGVSHTAVKQPDKAREDFDNVIRLDPKNALAYLNRGQVFLELKQSDKALADYDRASELDNHNPGVFLGRGVAYLELRKYEAAQKDLEQAISLNREFVPAYLKLAELFSAEKKQALAALNLGRAYFYSKQYAKATTEFARAAELEPKLAAAHFELGRSKSAQAILETSAATATDKNPDVHQDGIIDAATSDIVSRLTRPAVKSLEEAARLNPKDANTYLELGKAYFYWEPQSAIAAFEQAIKLEPKSAEAHFWLGVTKYTCGDQREVWKALSREQFRAQLALKDLNTAIALDPQHAGAYYFRADVNRTFERYQEAIDDLTAAIQRALPSQRYLEYGAIRYFPYKRMRDVTSIPDELLAISLKAAAYAQRGQCHSENRNEDAAIADLDQAMRFLPTDPKLFHLRAVVQEGRPDAKLADLRRAAQLAEQGKAESSKNAADYNTAIEEYQRRLKLDSSNAEAHVRLGDCYRGVGKYDLAQREYDQAIEVSPKAKALLDDSIEKEKTRYCYAAIYDLDDLTKMEPNNAALYFRKANLYLMDHDTEDANPNFRRAAELDPTNLQYAMRASHPATPSHQLTTEQVKDKVIGWVVGGTVTLFGLAAVADYMNFSDSKRAVEASGGRKKLCPVCKGSKVNLVPQASGMNPYMYGTYNYEEFERSKGITNIVPCQTCGGTGVVNNER
jgi:tetratricopeptide (TPR) repeat protein